MSIITNGDFQTGNFTGWTVTTNLSSYPQVTPYGRPVGPIPYYCSFFFSAPGFGASVISQTLSVGPNTDLTLSYWLAPAPFGPPAFGVMNLIVYGDIVNYINAGGLIPVGSGWVNYNASFTTTATETTVTVLFGCFEQASFANSFLLDDVSLVINPICYTGDTKIRVKNLLSNHVESVRADQITPSQYAVVNRANHAVPILKNIVAGPVTRFITLRQGLFSEFSPNEDLKLTRGHKVVVDDEEIKARYVKGGILTKTPPQMVYSLVCQDHQQIYANNTLVAAFSQEEWDAIAYSVAHSEMK